MVCCVFNFWQKPIYFIPQAKAMWKFIFVNGVGTNDE
jgi:hypothetical protein